MEWRWWRWRGRGRGRERGKGWESHSAGERGVGSVVEGGGECEFSCAGGGLRDVWIEYADAAWVSE